MFADLSANVSVIVRLDVKGDAQHSLRGVVEVWPLEGCRPRRSVEGRPVLSIGRLGVGQEGYYLGKVASGAEDYYLGSGEAAGRWTGVGASAFGVSGGVSPEQLRSVLAGLDPATGEQRTRPGTAKRPRVPGFDLTFSAPKSVSVLYAVGSGEIDAEVVAAHEAAVDAALLYLERHATFTRRRHDGEMEFHPGEGLTAAAFRHRTSRAGDPQLHTHCLVANAVRTADGVWGTLDSRSLYRYARTTGFVYQAVLRGELSARLGVAWGAVRNGQADIAGVPRAVLREFSRRRVEIEAHMAARGEGSSKAAQVATLATRRAKDYGVDLASLRQAWVARAEALGVDRYVVRTWLGHDTHQLDESAVELALAQLRSPEGLTARAASFDRRDVVRGLCEALPPGAPVSVEVVDALTERFVASDAVVTLIGRGPLGDRKDERRARDERRWSTPEMLAVERALLDAALARQSAAAGVAPQELVGAALAARPTLVADQAVMVERLTTSGAGVDVVVGKAGSGKTFALAAAAEAWRAGGYRVCGVALAARAASELEAASGIPSGTLARFLADVEAPRGQLDQRSVVVLDEAGMVDTRRLARVLAAAEWSGAKVVLVGDHRQLPEIEAGGAFGGLVRRLGAIELTQNRRQREPWEREALDDLRDGDVAEALAALSAEGRVVVAESGEDVRQNLVADWWAATSAGEQAVMVAARHRDVADLNARARQRRMAAGQLGGAELVADERAFAAGEQVVCLRNDRRLGVVNGTLATVVEVRSDDRSVVVETNDEARRELPAWYLEAGHLDHGYALTIHKAQGMTVDRCFVLGSDRLYREAGYVGLSRGRHSNHLYVAGPDEDEAGHQLADESELDVERVAAWLGRSAAKRLATDEGRLEELQRQRERLGELWRERDELGRQIALAAREATDRPNGIQRTVGTEQVRGQRASVGHRQRTKRPGWRRASSVVSRVWSGPRGDGVVAELPPDRSGEALEAQRQRIRRASELKEAIRRQAAVVAAGEEADPPDHLLRLIGPVPQPRESKHAQAWREAAAAVASYRARWGVHGVRDAIGPAPATPAQSAQLARVRSKAALMASPELSGQEREPWDGMSLGR